MTRFLNEGGFIFQNLMFYYESETSSRPSGIIFLEGCYSERIPSCIAQTPLVSSNVSGQGSKVNKEEKLQVRNFYEN